MNGMSNNNTVNVNVKVIWQFYGSGGACWVESQISVKWRRLKVDWDGEALSDATVYSICSRWHLHLISFGPAMAHSGVGMPPVRGSIRSGLLVSLGDCLCGM